MKIENIESNFDEVEKKNDNEVVVNGSDVYPMNLIKKSENATRTNKVIKNNPENKIRRCLKSQIIQIILYFIQRSVSKRFLFTPLFRK